MKIAVTYENGNVFQHFGHTESFKVYEVENGQVVSFEVINSNGTGHGALAGLLAGKDINVLICGGIGGGAMQALTENGIEVFAGASGNTDDAVETYLRGELESTGINCDHHGEGHSCGHHDGEGHCGHHGEEDNCGNDEEGCAGSCGGCGGCHMEPIMEGKNVGKTCRTHYKGTFNDGTVFDSSYDRGEPLEFVCGVGMMIRGFDEAVANMEVGEKKEIHLMPEEAYGQVDPEAVFTLELSQLPGSEELNAGEKVVLQNMYGQPVPVTVVEKTDKTITFDANHEMAGKELNFAIELVEIKE